MGHQVAASIHCVVYNVQFDLNSTKTLTSIVAKEIIMVPGDINNPRAGSG